MVPVSKSHPHLLKEWSPKNTVTLDMVSQGSVKALLWECEVAHHEWTAKVYNRTGSGMGCPFCSGRYPVVGETDLATTDPEIAAELVSVSPTTVKAGSQKTQTWKCPAEGHLWVISPYNRTKLGQNCYYCSGKRVLAGFNDLATTNPELAAEMDDPKYQATEVTAGSSARVSWKCNKNHKWEASIRDRVKKNTGCPFCNGRLPIPGETDKATLYPELAKEWSSKNPIAFKDIGRGYTDKIFWWECLHGHPAWQASLQNRIRVHSGCPFCSNRKIILGVNDLATTHPHLVLEWADTTILPTEVTAGSGKKVLWRCKDGHEWVTWVYARTGKNPSGCPTCSGSKGEREIADWLTSLGCNVSSRNRSVIAPYELDILLADKNIAIEFNGVYWHSDAVVKDKQYHVKKLERCEAAGIRLIQVWEDDWVEHPELIKRLILARIGLSDQKRIGARKASPSVITVDRAAVFLDNNHIQGRVPGSFYFGLEHAGELVAVMVFTKQGKGSTSVMLDRYATSAGIPGGFSKLLKFALSQMPGVTEVITFADREISQGDLYEQTGFVKDRIIPPDYKYVVNGKRIHKFNYRKARIKADSNLKYTEGMTERELMALNGIPRVWDSGKIRYVLFTD